MSKHVDVFALFEEHTELHPFISILSSIDSSEGSRLQYCSLGR